MKPAAEANGWAALRLDTDEGYGLVRPRFEARFAVEYPQPDTVLRFHDAVHHLIGNRLQWISTGSGHWSRRSARTESMMSTWCRDPVRWPKKIYTFIAQDTDEGVGDVELKIHYAAREPLPPPAAWLPRVLKGQILPTCMSTFSIALPVDHELVTSGAVLDWVRELPPLRDASFIGGSAGWALGVPLNPPVSTQGPAARARAGALLQRHPGLTCYSHMALWAARLMWDPAFALAKGAAIPRPYIPRADWITLLNADQVGLLGGIAALRTALAPAGDAVAVESVGMATLIRAGHAPQLGDLSAGSVPAEYRAVAQAIAPVTLPIAYFQPNLGNAFGDHGLRTWYDALAKP